MWFDTPEIAAVLLAAGARQFDPEQFSLTLTMEEDEDDGAPVVPCNLVTAALLETLAVRCNAPAALLCFHDPPRVGNGRRHL